MGDPAAEHRAPRGPGVINAAPLAATEGSLHSASGTPVRSMLGSATTDVADQFGWDLIQKPAGDVAAHIAPQHPAPRVRDEQKTLRPGDADVTKPSFLLEFDRISERPEVREDPVLHSHHETGRELEPLGDVHGHQGHLAPVITQLVS